MTRLLLALFLAAFIAPAAYSQTAPAPSNSKTLEEMKNLLEAMKPDPLVMEMAKQHYLLRYDNMRNKIGFMKYCDEKQLLDADAAKKAANTFIKTVNILFYDKETASHRSYDRESGDEAERQGRLGIMYYKDWTQTSVLAQRLNGRSLDEHAKKTKTTAANICKEWAGESSAYEPGLSQLNELDAAREKAAPSDPAKKE